MRDDVIPEVRRLGGRLAAARILGISADQIEDWQRGMPISLAGLRRLRDAEPEPPPVTREELTRAIDAIGLDRILRLTGASPSSVYSYRRGITQIPSSVSEVIRRILRGEHVDEPPVVTGAMTLDEIATEIARLGGPRATAKVLGVTYARVYGLRVGREGITEEMADRLRSAVPEPRMSVEELREIVAILDGPRSAGRHLNISPHSVWSYTRGRVPIPNTVAERARELAKQRPKSLKRRPHRLNSISALERELGVASGRGRRG